MITVSKEFQFAMAHMLEGHAGLCQNLHGHEYKLIVTLANKKILQEAGTQTGGMVIDFKNLKNIVNKIIVDPLDHALMLNANTTDAFEMELINLADKFKKKHVVVPFRPTAENMVDYFEFLIRQELKGSSLTVVQLRLYETPTSYAEWIKGEI